VFVFVQAVLWGVPRVSCRELGGGGSDGLEQSAPWEADSHLVGKEISRLLWNPKVHWVFTRARHWYQSWVRWVQSVYSHSTSVRSVLILSSHKRLGLPNDLFPSDFPTKIVCAFLIYQLHATCPAHYILIDLNTHVTKFLIMRSSTTSLLAPNIPLGDVFLSPLLTSFQRDRTKEGPV